MSYASGAALQVAVYDQLRNDAALIGLVGDAVYDVVPAGETPELYVVIGPELVRDKSDATGSGAEHELTISVVARDAGFAVAKSVAAAVSDALVDAEMPLSRGQLVSLRFYRARASRLGVNEDRQINLSFRARICDG